MFISEDTVQTVLHRTKQLKYVKMYMYVSISLFVVMLTPPPPPTPTHSLIFLLIVQSLKITIMLPGCCYNSPA